MDIAEKIMRVKEDYDKIYQKYQYENALKESIISREITEIYSNTTSLDKYIFYNCEKLKKAHFPNATYIGGVSLNNCKALVDIYIPKVHHINGRAFENCSSLNYIDMPCVNNLYGGNNFLNCNLLDVVVLRSSLGFCTLGNISSFQGTPIELGTGYVYVPRDLIESYKTATNWTTYASQFRALEDYTVDGTIDGELDWDKVNGGTA